MKSPGSPGTKPRSNSVAVLPASGTTRLEALDLPSEIIEGDGPEWLVCPVTMELMMDPVVAADGHTYEREALIDMNC